MLVRRSHSEDEFDIASDFIGRVAVLKNTRFMSIHVLDGGKVRVKRLKVGEWDFSWSRRVVDGPGLS